MGKTILFGRKDKGQALLIIILILVVALTIGLSIALRSVTTVRLTTEEQDSQKALAAAEAGIERVLKTGASLSNVTLSNNATIRQVDISPISGDEVLINAGLPVVKDDGIDIWFTNYPDYSGSLYNPNFFSLFWGDSNESCTPNPGQNMPAAIEVIILSGSVANPTTTRKVYDPCAAARGNNFNQALDTSNSKVVQGSLFGFRTKPNGNDSLFQDVSNAIIARVVPLYASTRLGISTCNPGGGSCGTCSPGSTSCPLPSQGNKLESTGVSGNTQRKLAVFQGYPKLPSELFQYILFSP